MIDMIKEAAVSMLTAQCILRVHRGSSVLPWIDDGSGKGTLRPQSVEESVKASVVEGKVLARAIVEAVK